MERMTFHIPPVFLFGNKVRYNQEKKKAEYKTAAETEIKVENWREKRIAELEEENKKLKEENEKLRETIKDHQFYEEKLEHRIIEFEELLHGE